MKPTSLARPTLAELAAARARLAAAGGRQKLRILFDAPDPRALVRSLPAEDLYFALREIGLGDAAEVVGLAAPTQFRAFVDLDAWEGESPDPERLLLWLRLSLEGCGSVEHFRAQRAALDPELVVLLLRTRTTVHPLVEGEDPVLTSDNWLRTAEGKYLVEIHAEGDDGATLRKLLEDFIAENPFEATRLFEAVRWEVATELEENCLRWRQGRLRDMGFPAFEEAVRIWSPLPAGWQPTAETIATGAVPGVPALLFAGARHGLLLDTVSAQLDDAARGRFNQGLVYLLNCALVADGVEPRDLELARGTLDAARDTLSLGLELAAEGDQARALALLSVTPPVTLFRRAVTTLMELQREAVAAAATVRVGAGTGTLMDSPDAEALSALRRRRPRFWDGQTERAFRDRADIVAAQVLLVRTRATGLLLAGLGLDHETATRMADSAGHALSAVTAGQLVRTRLITHHLGVTQTALPSRLLPALADLFTGGQLSASARAVLQAAPEPVVQQFPATLQDAARTLVSGWLDTLSSELGPPAAAGPLDARFVESLVLIAEN